MLDAYIIEQIKRREQKDERLQPRLDHPSRFPFQGPPPGRAESERDRRERRDDEDSDGIVIIDM